MPLTPTQLQSLKTNLATNAATVLINGQPVAISAVPVSPDNARAVAGWYNLAAAPAWTVWRRNVTLTEIRDRLNGSELAGLSTLNHTRLQTVVILANVAGGIDPSKADQRAFFDDIFSGAGGTNTRGNLLTLWKKTATNAEKLFSTGTGSDAAPATTAANITEGFLLTGSDVLAAWAA